MRLYIIAGEASGDLHGGNLVKALKAADPSLEIRAWGGDRMAAEGATVVKHIRELAFMGFTEVVMNLRTIMRNMRFCKQDIAEWKPDAILLIDYPGFNLRIAEYAHGLGIKVFYYISPQLWAWKANRVHTIKRVVDRMFVILPFEKAWYAKHGVEVDFVGHPLLDELASKEQGSAPVEKEGIALLPGSRKQEIGRMLPVMLQVAERFPKERFIVCAAPSIPDEYYRSFIGTARVELVHGRTYEVLRSAKAALVTSGTATLETALIGTPEAVCYAGGAVSVMIARRVVNVPFISLVNLIMEREVVKEFIQGEMNADTLTVELKRMLDDENYRSVMRNDLDSLREKLGGTGASERVALQVLKSLGR